MAVSCCQGAFTTTAAALPPLARSIPFGDGGVLARNFRPRNFFPPPRPSLVYAPRVVIIVVIVPLGTAGTPCVCTPVPRTTYTTVGFPRTSRSYGV